MGILFLCEAHDLFSNTGVPHLFVDVITVNNARYCDKESASGDNFSYGTFLKMVAEYAPISQEGSNFRKKTAKKFILPSKFQKVRFEMHKKFTNFFEYLRYNAYHTHSQSSGSRSCRR